MRTQLSHVYKVHVVSDCVVGRCYFRPVNVYIQPTNWFVDPDKASLLSLTTALKKHALHLLNVRETAARLHRNFLVRKPASWLSRMKARLAAELGAVCFMQPAAIQQHRGTEPVRLLRSHKQAKLTSLFESSQKDQVFVSFSDSLPLDAQTIDLRQAGVHGEEYRRALEQAPQNVFGLCRRPVSIGRCRLSTLDGGYSVVRLAATCFPSCVIDGVHLFASVSAVMRSAVTCCGPWPTRGSCCALLY